MGTAKELLVELTRRGISLQVVADGLRYRAPEGALTPDLRRELTAYKTEILGTSLYSGVLIADALARIADVWDADVECQGVGDAAWTWIKRSSHWQTILDAEGEVNRIGSQGDPDALNAACH